jgi:hypothetical protein
VLLEVTVFHARVKRKMNIKVRLENTLSIYHLRNIGIYRSIILKCIFIGL